MAPKSSLALANRLVGDTSHTGHDWVLIPVRLVGIDVLFVAVYLDCTIGYCGPNVEKLKSLATVLLRDKRPFVLVGDWNMTGAQLIAIGGLAYYVRKCWRQKTRSVLATLAGFWTMQW